MIQTVLAGRPGPVLAIALSCVLGFGSTGFAQADDFIPPLPRVRSAIERPVPSGPFGPRGTDLLSAAAVSNTRQLTAAPARASNQFRMPTGPPSRRGSRARQVTAGIIGGVLGMWAGAEFGAALEGDSCHCDSPGMMGALYGASAGGTIGAVLGAFLAGK